MLLVFILEVKIYGVVSYTQETEFGRGQKVSGQGGAQIAWKGWEKALFLKVWDLVVKLSALLGYWNLVQGCITRMIQKQPFQKFWD